MKKPTSSRKSASVSTAIGTRLHTYALAATAAGVSAFALAQPGEAEIIYTPANTEIGINRTVGLDLTGDGTVDFNFVDQWFSTIGGFDGLLTVAAAQTGNEVITSSHEFASALRVGQQIGPGGMFSPYSRAMGDGAETSSGRRWACSGPWKDKKNRYLGLEFMISGEVHYGWARLTETCHRGQVTALLTGYAYETTAGEGLKAGDKKGKLEDESVNGAGEAAPASGPVQTPTTLGILAKGASTLRVRQTE